MVEERWLLDDVEVLYQLVEFLVIIGGEARLLR